MYMYMYINLKILCMYMLYVLFKLINYMPLSMLSLSLSLSLPSSCWSFVDSRHLISHTIQTLQLTQKTLSTFGKKRERVRRGGREGEAGRQVMAKTFRHYLVTPLCPPLSGSGGKFLKIKFRYCSSLHCFGSNFNCKFKKRLALAQI